MTDFSDKAAREAVRDAIGPAVMTLNGAGELPHWFHQTKRHSVLLEFDTKEEAKAMRDALALASV